MLSVSRKWSDIFRVNESFIQEMSAMFIFLDGEAARVYLRLNLRGAFHSTKNSEIFETGTNFQGNVPENPQIVEFPKSEAFNRKFRKFMYEKQMERKFSEKKMFENLGIL